MAEVLVIHPDDRRLELYRFPNGEAVLVQADPDFGVQLTALRAWIQTIDTLDGPRLAITWDGGETLI